MFSSHSEIGRWHCEVGRVLEQDGSVAVVGCSTNLSGPTEGFRATDRHIEIYTNAYTTMGAHSDQALDLDDATEIALFSCYERAEAGSPARRLLVEAKEPGGPAFAIPLAHNSVVVFSADTNRRFRHRIVQGPAAGPPNSWLGITFRTSKTFVCFRGEQPYLPDGTCLTLASDEERRELYRLRRRENHELAFTYPRITYTLSPSDLRPPAPRAGEAVTHDAALGSDQMLVLCGIRVGSR